ncbi:MAG: fumarate hydratase, partial [Thermoplasmata archaeon HGW-Thermoplasmata-1]
MADIESFSDAVAQLIFRAETHLPPDVVSFLENAAAREEGGMGKSQMDAILKNIGLADKKSLPLCQDTGMQTFYVRVGAHFPFSGLIEEGIISGVRKATEQIPLRPNAVDPFTNRNSGDNTGAGVPIIHWEVTKGNSCEIIAFPKGGGSENCSTLKMFDPGDGMDAVKRFIADWVVRAGGKPCPPVIVGVGIGGGADTAMKLAKKALLRKTGQNNEDAAAAGFER